MDDLLKSISQGVRSIVGDDGQSKQLMTDIGLLQAECQRQAADLASLRQLLEQYRAQQNEHHKQLATQMETVLFLQKSQNMLIKEMSSLKTQFNEIVVPPKREQAVESQFEGNMTNEGSQWPCKWYADSYSSYKPLGFTENDLQSTYREQLFLVEQTACNSALFTINTQLEFGTLIANFKYVLKDVCQVQERSDTPVSLTVVQSGRMQLANGIWEIKEKVIIKII